MKAKLKKIDPNYFLIVDDKTFGSTMEPHLSASIRHALSLKNCQAIERGYDLDELAVEVLTQYNWETFPSAIKVFKAGFQKALELMNDKKFTEEDLRRAMDKISAPSYSKGLGITAKFKERNKFIDTYIQSLQQNEWDVEIEMEEISIGDKYTPDPKPILDADGCLILKCV